MLVEERTRAMIFMKYRCLMLAACIGLATLVTARAQADDIPTYDVRVGHGLGVMSTESGGVTLDGRALLRAHIFGIGGHIATSTWLLATSASAALDAGFVWRDQRFRFEVLGRLGEGIYNVLDRGTALPFAGSEISGAYLWERSSGRNLMLGGSVILERDLRSGTIEYSPNCGWDEESCGSETVLKAGWTRVGGQITLAMQFDLGWGKAPQGTNP